MYGIMYVSRSFVEFDLKIHNMFQQFELVVQNGASTAVCIHPRKTNMDPKLLVPNRNLLFQVSIFKCHVSFRGINPKVGWYTCWYCWSFSLSSTRRCLCFPFITIGFNRVAQSRLVASICAWLLGPKWVVFGLYIPNKLDYNHGWRQIWYIIYILYIYIFTYHTYITNVYLYTYFML